MIKEKESNNPLISVIVPVYNVEKYLRKCLDSIINQTYTNLEILLVDDGSTDSSGDICDKYALKDSRIRVFHKENGGLSSARNYALGHVTGKYLHYVDSDDWIDTDLYRRCVGEFIKDSSLEYLYLCSAMVSKDERSINVPRIVVNKYIRNSDGLDPLYSYISGALWPAVWRKVYKFDLIKDLRFVEGTYCEDLEYTFWAISRNSKFLILKDREAPYVAYYYNRMNENAITHVVKRIPVIHALTNSIRIYNECECNHSDLVRYAGYFAIYRVKSISLKDFPVDVIGDLVCYMRNIGHMKTLDTSFKSYIERFLIAFLPYLYLMRSSKNRRKILSSFKLFKMFS